MNDLQPWQPWDDLARRPDIRFYLKPLPEGAGAVHQMRGRLHVIVIDSRFGKRDRKHLLGHELVHIERGGGCPRHGWMPTTWGPVIAREEERVETITTNRLVPPRLLARLAWQACETEGRLDPWTVADHFRVPEHVAERALWLLDPENVAQPVSLAERLAG